MSASAAPTAATKASDRTAAKKDHYEGNCRSAQRRPWSAIRLFGMRCGGRRDKFARAGDVAAGLLGAGVRQQGKGEVQRCARKLMILLFKATEASVRNGGCRCRRLLLDAGFGSLGERAR